MTHTQLSKLDVDGEVISTAQGILVGAVDALPTTATEGIVLYDRSSRTFQRFKNGKWASEELDIADATLNAESTRPIQNKAVTTKINSVETIASDKYTKAEINNKLSGYQPAGSYVNTDAFNTYKGEVSSTYATKEELNSQASRVLRFIRTVTSDELDAIQDPAIGDVYNLSTDRVFGGKTFKAGTSWVYEYNAAGSKAWEPLGGNFEIEAPDVDLSSRQPKNVYLTNVKATWTADTTVEGFTYKGKISQATITANDAATVIFDSAQAMSGNYSSVCNTITDGIEIWSKTNADITIPCVIIQKGA